MSIIFLLLTDASLPSVLQTKVNSHKCRCVYCSREKLQEAQSDLQKKKEVIDDLEPKVDSNSKECHVDGIQKKFSFVPFLNTNLFFLLVAKKIDELQEILRKKDEDMKQMEQRYKRYVEKARTVSGYRSTALFISHIFKDFDLFKYQKKWCSKLFKLISFCVQVIKTLDPKQQPVAPDSQAMKNQLMEKERRIQHLEVWTSDSERQVCFHQHCKSH